MPADSLEAFCHRGTQEQKLKSSPIFAYGTITRYGSAFQPIRLTKEFVTLPPFANREIPKSELREKQKSVSVLQPPPRAQREEIRNSKSEILNKFKIINSKF